MGITGAVFTFILILAFSTDKNGTGITTPYFTMVLLNMIEKAEKTV